MAGKKHFNVWIVYSDLFSNLAVFLFISAFGLFASLGNGTFYDDGQQKSVTQCVSNIKEVDDALVGSDIGSSGPIRSEFSPAKGGTCSGRFDLRGFRYRYGAFDLPSFVTIEDHGTKGDMPISASVLLHGICSKLWKAATQPGLAKHSGQIIIFGTASESEKSDPFCSATNSEGKNISFHKILTDFDDSDIELIDSCQKLIVDSSGKLAAAGWPAKCLKKGSRAELFKTILIACTGQNADSTASLCGDLAERKSRLRSQKVTCPIRLATARAEELYNYCRNARFDQTVRDNRPSDDWLKTWGERVKYSGEIDQAGQGPNGTNPTSGAIFLSVQFAPHREVIPIAERNMMAALNTK